MTLVALLYAQNMQVWNWAVAVADQVLPYDQYFAVGQGVENFAEISTPSLRRCCRLGGGDGDSICRNVVVEIAILGGGDDPCYDQIWDSGGGECSADGYWG